MKDILQDVVAKTHSLGFLSLVKVNSEADATTIESMAEDRSVILNSTTHNPVAEFNGTFGMPNLDKLALHLKNPEYQKDAKIDEVVASFQSQLEEKNEELTKIRDSKRVFADRSEETGAIAKWGKELMYAHMAGVMLGNKSLDQTDYGKSIIEKAGISYATSAPNIATEVSSQIEKEILSELRLAQAFREVQFNSQAQVLPIQTDTNLAAFQSGAATTPTLENKTQVAANTYQPSQVVLKAYRLISSTLMDNHIDEEVLINLSLIHI